MNNTIYDNDSTAARALACTRGCYQESLAAGDARWSGADLQGRARSYGARYADSRASLVARWRAAGLGVEMRREGAGKRIVCYVTGS